MHPIVHLHIRHFAYIETTIIVVLFLESELDQSAYTHAHKHTCTHTHQTVI